ncbi:MAG: hypothetical protein JNK26_00620 [Candidatus Doudnabacteria bacterium]|nr:hypothetical protein [Candidatus Doudnabacteria bacterium]
MLILKKIIAPIQARLLEKRLCPGCTRNLDSQLDRENISHETERVTCKCGRKYVFTRAHRKYVRTSN